MQPDSGRHVLRLINRVQKLPHTGLQAVLTGDNWKTQMFE
jgi:hypothetical protein